MIKLHNIPRSLVRGFILIEDRRFYKHGGIDLRGILRAAWNNICSFRFAQGGSTITQQLARLKYGLPHERTISRKLCEMLLARHLERSYHKHEILEQYLNTIYLGEGSHGPLLGIESAAKHFFNKEVCYLNIWQQAMIIGIARGPTIYNPNKHSERAFARCRLVMDVMHRHRLI